MYYFNEKEIKKIKDQPNLLANWASPFTTD